jgi:hypothetical protein
MDLLFRIGFEEKAVSLNAHLHYHDHHFISYGSMGYAMIVV